MRILRGIAIALLIYVGIVTLFESMIGTLQPQTPGSTLVLTTRGDDGSAHDRVVSKLESGGRLYVAANHWPRAWYHRLLENPQVRVTLDGVAADYQAVPVDSASEEHAQVAAANAVPGWFRIVTGFAPRYFIRLDPVGGAAAPAPQA